VVGDGPLSGDLRVMADIPELQGHVNFTGNLNLDGVARHMAECHVFCLPSIRESGGAVLLEAMASVRPVIALDFGGPAEIVDDAVGRLLPMRSHEQVVEDLVNTLREVVSQPEIWKQRGLNGRQRVVSEYSWPAKIEAAKTLYQQVLTERGVPC